MINYFLFFIHLTKIFRTFRIRTIRIIFCKIFFGMKIRITVLGFNFLLFLLFNSVLNIIILSIKLFNFFELLDFFCFLCLLQFFLYIFLFLICFFIIILLVNSLINYFNFFVILFFFLLALNFRNNLFFDRN